MRYRFASLALVLALVPGVQAQVSREPPTQAPMQGPSALSLHQAIERASTHEARYLAAEASFRADREVLAQSRALLLPEVSASAGRAHNDLSAVLGGAQTRTQHLAYYSGGATISLRQPLYRPENWARYQQARAEVNRLQAVLDGDRNRLHVEVASAYLEVLRALAEYRALEAQRQYEHAQAAAAARGVTLELASASERDEREARAQLAALRTLQAEAGLTQARRTLEQMVGEPITQLLALGEDRVSANDFMVESLPAWLERAQADSPAVRAARAAVNVAREGVRRAEAAHKPTLDLLASHSKSSSETFSAINNTYYNSAIGVQLTVSLYAGGRFTSGVRQAVAQQQKARAELDLALRTTALQVEREHATVRQAAQRLNAHRAVVESARLSLQGSQRGVQSGTHSELDVLQAQMRLETARQERLAATVELLAARVRLQALTGDMDGQAAGELAGVLFRPVRVSVPR